MTLDDLERQNRGLYGFFGNFGLQHRFWAATQISRANCAEINRDTHGETAYEISALNVDFDGPGLNFLGLRKPVHEGIKERYTHKSRYFTVVGQSFVTMVANRHGQHCLSQQTLGTSFSVVSTSMTLKDPELPK